MLPAETIERSTGIGCSELADVLNEGYGCRRKMVFRKRNIPQDYPTRDDSLLMMQRGKALEPLIIARYLQGRPGLKAVRRPPVRHQTLPLMASVDREILGDPRGVGVAELKSHNQWVFGRYLRDGLPASHVLQLNAYLFVRQRAWGAFAVLEPTSWRFFSVEVERDDSLIEAIVPQIEQAWKEVTIGPLPPPLDPRDPRCARCEWRRTCHGGELVAAIPADDRGVALERDEAVAPLLADLRDAKTWAEEATDVVEQIKERVRDAIGDRPGVECSGYRAYFREQIANRIDTAGLRAKHPALAKEFERPVKSRPLRIFPT